MGSRGYEFESILKKRGCTNFSGSGFHFCPKFDHYSRTVGRTGSATSPSCVSSNFT